MVLQVGTLEGVHRKGHMVVVVEDKITTVRALQLRNGPIYT
jgi:hypothetical protein